MQSVNANSLFIVQNFIAENDSEQIKSFDTYAEAYDFINENSKKYDNLGIYYDDVLYYIETGIIAFKNTDCEINTAFTNFDTKAYAYSNACYGRDGAFINYDDKAEKVTFYLSGVKGEIDVNEVNILPIENANKVSSFTVKEENLFHNIQTKIPSDIYSTSFTIDKTPSYLNEDTSYYSYDSHYFYDDFDKMIIDYRNGNRKEAINADEPYYNYYQYLPHRTSSQYTEIDYANYFKDTLKINSSISNFVHYGSYIHSIYTQSLLPNALSSFMQYQNEFGSNSLLMLGLSINESAYGRSNLTFTRNNAFGHAAFDSDVEASASRYQGINNSVYSHALNYISKSYASPSSDNYNGSFLGNKAKGMNVAYASDPYWGEKAVHYAFKMDEANGFKDKNIYSIGILKETNIAIREQPKKDSPVIQDIANGQDFAFVLLDKIEDKNETYYRIQTESALNSDKSIQENGAYSFAQSFGYIRENDLKHIVGKKKQESKNYIDITFDANGGTFYPDRANVTLQVESGLLPSCTIPTKENALFIEWDKKIVKASNNVTYTAVYKDVNDIQLITRPKSEYQINETLDVTKGEIKVLFKDGTSENVAIETEMVTNFSTKEEGNYPINIAYAGTSCSYEISVKNTLTGDRANLNSQLDSAIKNYNELEDVNEEGLLQIKQVKDSYLNLQNDNLSIERLRSLDSILYKNDPNKAQVIINDNNYDLAISGIQSAIKLENKNWFFFVPNTVKVSISDRVERNMQDLIKPIAKVQDRTVEELFTLSATHNGSGFHPLKRVVYSIKKPNTNANLRYYVVSLDDEQAQLVSTSQSADRIVFQTDKLGGFAVLSEESTSIEATANTNETHTIANNGTDHIKIFILYPIMGVISIAFLAVIAIMIRRRLIKIKKKSLNQ